MVLQPAIPKGKRVLPCTETEMELYTDWIMQSCASKNLFHLLKGSRLIELLSKSDVAIVLNLNMKCIRQTLKVKFQNENGRVAEVTF
jgi:hypothetical protein